MKRYFLCVLTALFCVTLFSQEATIKVEGSSGNIFLHGLFNERTQRWVVSPRYANIIYIGSYNGTHYWEVLSAETSLWGIVSSDTYRERVAPTFTQIIRTETFSSRPLVCVKKNSDWGLMEVGTKSCYYLKRCQYKEVYPQYDGSIYFAQWDGKQVGFSVETLKKLYDNAVQQEAQEKKEALEKKQREEQERRDRLAKEQKMRELASFTEYAKKYVTPLVNEWQQKGEFEKLATYQERVTGANREQKIRIWTKEAEDAFIKENAELNPLTGMTLGVYDSENEVFSITSPKFGQLLVPVPIEEGKAFKDNFAFVEYRDPVYFVENDKIALKSVNFYNKQNGKTYYYNNQAALNYTQYEIDADKLDLAPVRITTSTTSTSPSAQAIKPTCEILSPDKGSSYSTPTILLRYLAHVAPNIGYTVKFLVAGQEVMPIEHAPQKSKGATNVQGIEVELPMPQEIGRETAVSVQVVDNYGTWAEPKTILLKYAGEKPKPTLHVLAVGISNYPASDLQNLNYAAKDAQDFVKTIGKSDLSMYKEFKSTLILNDEATTSNLRRQLTQLASRVGQDDVVMLFFSGHGINQNDEKYFMTSSSSAEEYYNGLEFNFIRERMTNMAQNKHCRVVVFMDACQSGAMFSTKGTVKDITFAAPGIVGFYSSTASEQSAEQDDIQNGVFTKVLLDGLKGAAVDKDGQITLHQLDSYVKKHVSEQTKGRQTPIVENSTGDAVLFHTKK